MKNLLKKTTWIEYFPIKPIPEDIFLPGECKRWDEFCDDIFNTFLGKAWTKINAEELFSIAPPTVLQLYMRPSVFAYYIPSFLYGTYAYNIDNIWKYDFDFLQALMPTKSSKVDKQWWVQYYNSFSKEQKNFLKLFLKEVYDKLDFHFFDEHEFKRRWMQDLE